MFRGSGISHSCIELCCEFLLAHETITSELRNHTVYKQWSCFRKFQCSDRRKYSQKKLIKHAKEAEKYATDLFYGHRLNAS